jgi:hypothetical protein
MTRAGPQVCGFVLRSGGDLPEIFLSDHQETRVCLTAATRKVEVALGRAAVTRASTTPDQRPPDFVCMYQYSHVDMRLSTVAVTAEAPAAMPALLGP